MRCLLENEARAEAAEQRAERQAAAVEKSRLLAQQIFAEAGDESDPISPWRSP